MPEAPESWRRIAALHRELARRSANGIYFLTCRDAAKAFPGLSHQAAYSINLALAQLGVVEIVHKGDPRPTRGRAAQFRYLLSQTGTPPTRATKTTLKFRNGVLPLYARAERLGKGQGIEVATIVAR